MCLFGYGTIVLYFNNNVLLSFLFLHMALAFYPNFGSNTFFFFINSVPYTLCGGRFSFLSSNIFFFFLFLPLFSFLLLSGCLAFLFLCPSSPLYSALFLISHLSLFFLHVYGLFSRRPLGPMENGVIGTSGLRSTLGTHGGLVSLSVSRYAALYIF